MLLPPPKHYPRLGCACDCLQMKERLASAVDEIREIMASIHRVFEQDSEDVQREWVRFTQKVDRKLEDALRHVIKKSLQVGHADRV